MSNQSISVLLVEDNGGDQGLIRAMISEFGNGDFTLRTVTTVGEAFEALNEHPGDVCLLDLTLPDSDGLRALDRILAAHPTMPIVVLTGLNDEEQAVRAVRNGAQDYLVKGQFEGPMLIRSMRYAIERKRIEDELRTANLVQRRLLSELHHRVRNNLSSLIALIEMSGRKSDSVTEFAGSMAGRVRAMAAAHSVLSQSNWQQQHFIPLLSGVLPSREMGRIDYEGDELVLPPHQVTALAMVIHELAENAVRHGALSVEDGELLIRWQHAEPGADAPDAAYRMWKFEWIERNGPDISPPEHPGIGMKMIEGLIRSELQGDVAFSFGPEGVHHVFTIRLEDLKPIDHQGEPQTAMSG